MNIYEALEKYYHFALDKYSERQVFGVFLYGSQNYGLSSPNSDYDVYILVVPSMREIAA